MSKQLLKKVNKKVPKKETNLDRHLRLFSEYKHYDDANHKRSMDALRKFEDEPDKDGGFQCYYLFVDIGQSEIIYKMASRKRVLTTEQLYEVVKANLPLEIANNKYFNIMISCGDGSRSGGYGAIYPKQEIDLGKKFVFYIS